MELTRSHLRNATLDEHKRKLAQCAEVLGKYFQKWAVIFPNHPTGAVALTLYLEALDDLTPQQIDAGCKEATRTAEQFPKPGHIRRGLIAAHDGETILLGPPLLDYGKPMTDAERRQCDEITEAFRNKLKTIPEALRDAEGNHTEKCLCQECRRRRRAP